jgi:hypothetical protein
MIWIPRGSYVSRSTGNGYCVPAEALINGGSPVIEQVSAKPSRLVKISDNPFNPPDQGSQLSR